MTTISFMECGIQQTDRRLQCLHQYALDRTTSRATIPGHYFLDRTSQENRFVVNRKYKEEIGELHTVKFSKVLLREV